MDAVTVRRGLVRTPLGHVHYREAGEGPALVLLHINQHSSALMLEMIEAIAAPGGMRAVAIDYPSHGDSDHVAAQTSIADYARCVLAVMDALGLREATLLGEATGAAVAVEAARQAPSRVPRVVMVNCPFLGDEAMRAALLDEMMHKLRPADASGYPKLRTVEYMVNEDPDHAPMRPTQSWMDRINQAQMEAGRDRWQALVALTQYDLGAALEKLACPALLLMGEHFYFGHRAPEIRRRVKDLRYEILRGARFCATWEFAERIADRAMAFAREGR